MVIEALYWVGIRIAIGACTIAVSGMLWETFKMVVDRKTTARSLVFAFVFLVASFLAGSAVCYFVIKLGRYL